MVSAAHARPRAGRARTVAVFSGILLAVVFLVAVGDVRDVFGRQYEYEEDLTRLDGAGTLTIMLLSALAALRGIEAARVASIDRDRIRALFESAVTRSIRAPPVARRGRDFVQITLVRRRPQVEPGGAVCGHAMSSRARAVRMFRQIVGASP